MDALRGRHRIRERIAAVGGAEDGAAEPEDAGDVSRREHARSIRLDEPVETVFEADDLDAAVGRGLDHGADDRVGASRPPVGTPMRSIADMGASVAGRRRPSRCGGRNPRGTIGVRLGAASSVGRAPRSQRGGREFEPPAVHQPSLACHAKVAHRSAEREGGLFPADSELRLASQNSSAKRQRRLPLFVVRRPRPTFVDTLWTDRTSRALRVSARPLSAYAALQHPRRGGQRLTSPCGHRDRARSCATAQYVAACGRSRRRL